MVEAFVGTWKSTAQEGDLSKFLTERGVPLPVRKVLELLSTRGEFIFEVKDGKFCETEVGMIKNTVKTPIPLDGTVVDGTSPAGESTKISCTFEGGVLTITENITDDDAVIQELTMDGDKIRRKFVNKKSGTSFIGILTKK